MSFDVATVWLEEGHQIARKWLPLMDPTDLSNAPSAYVKCDIKLIVPGVEVHFEEMVMGSEEDSIEENLMAPDSFTYGRQRAAYSFSIYWARILRRAHPVFRDLASGRHIEVYIRIAFGGLKGKTSSKNISRTSWNEKITFFDVYPPLGQRVKVEVRCDKKTYCRFFVDMNTISKGHAEGFLPTFGPSLTHLYGPYHDSKPHPVRERYRGYLAWSLTTELEAETSPIKTRSVTSGPTDPLEEEPWEIREVCLVGVAFSGAVSRHGHTDKALQLELCMGAFGETSDDPDIRSATQHNQTFKFRSKRLPRNIVHFKKFCRHFDVDFSNGCPCFYIQAKMPVVLCRVFNSNRLNWITSILKWGMWSFKHEHFGSIESLTDVLKKFARSCTSYLQQSESWLQNETYLTALDRVHIQFCRSEVANITRQAERWLEALSPETINTLFRQLRLFLKKLEILIIEPQDMMPHVIVWLVKNGKRVAFSEISARLLLHSRIQEEGGENAGKMNTLTFQPSRNLLKKNNNKPMAIFEIFLCLGIDEGIEFWKSMLPPGYEPFSPGKNESIPRAIIYKNTTNFRARAYIHQGIILAGSDKSGLCDALIRVRIVHVCSHTEVKKSTLNPCWNQMLEFPTVTLFGNSEEYICNNPPSVYVEMLDRDIFDTTQLVGSVSLIPTVITSSGTLVKSSIPPVLGDFEGLDSTLSHTLEESSEHTHGSTSLVWYPLFQEGNIHTGDVLAAFTLERVSSVQMTVDHTIQSIPGHVSPHTARYRMVVLFWGLRDFNYSGLLPVSKVHVSLQCNDQEVLSSKSAAQRGNLDFSTDLQFSDFILPTNTEYLPAITIKVIGSERTGRKHLMGCHVIRNVLDYIDADEGEEEVFPKRILFQFTFKKGEAPRIKGRSSLIPPQTIQRHVSATPKTRWINLYNVLTDSSELEKDVVLHARERRQSNMKGEEEASEDETSDWWTKYYAGIKNQQKHHSTDLSEEPRLPMITVYPCELEQLPEFESFKDTLRTFNIHRGHWFILNEDSLSHSVGKLKAALQLYELRGDASEVESPKFQIERIKRLIVRVYVVRGINLAPKDHSGRSDPYVYLQLGRKRINDRDHYIPRDVNPVFGRYFQFDATFPKECKLKIAILDYDAASSDDLIGETTIDLENRFYSKHRGTCGISARYDEAGYNAWRDAEKPTEILAEYCKRFGVDGPHYQDNCVVVGPCVFSINMDTDETQSAAVFSELLALKALHHWQHIPFVGCHLVPEHVETRSLFNPSKPGIEQGKLQLWIDLLHADKELPNPVDISPRKPESYELRCIVWNTEEVILMDDDFFLGEKVSDIYVKGWLTNPKDNQKTDVHYRSLTGEGLFNWRFIFAFCYLSAEGRIVVTKTRKFSKDTFQEKIPCLLNLQVWDNDHFTSDDYIGQLCLDLSRLKRGAKDASQCNLRVMDPDAPTINLFKVKRTRGWWPFEDVVDNDSFLVGKVELELQLMTQEEAAADPAGKGRSDPNGLSKPKRPDTSFSIIRNPFRAFVYVACHRFKWRCLQLLVLILIVLFFGLAIYSAPGYFVKKLLGA